jgi:methylthioribose-1-phosphate isomerase
MEPASPIPPTIEWIDGRIRLVDQRRLPQDLRFIDATTIEELCEAITDLAIRGAPALGAAGAMGVALAACRGDDLDEAAARLIATRPTAVNLRWGVERARAAADPLKEAIVVGTEDSVRNRRLGRLGAALIPPGARVLTHCNAGSLACVEYGTTRPEISCLSGLTRRGPYCRAAASRPGNSGVSGFRRPSWSTGQRDP